MGRKITAEGAVGEIPRSAASTGATNVSEPMTTEVCSTSRDRMATFGEVASACTMTCVRNVVVLGSTGSIGTQALDLIERNPDRFRVVALAAGGAKVELLAQQALRFK